MNNYSGTAYVKRTQKDYSMSFKLQVVAEVEGGELSISGAARKYGIQNRSTISNWLRKFGTFDWQTQTPSVMKRTPEQTIFELAQKVKLLEKQKTILEHQLDFQSEKAIFFDMIKAPKPCIEYVITHELCHLIHRDHTKAFFELLETEMPDWKRWKDKLERFMS